MAAIWLPWHVKMMGSQMAAIWRFFAQRDCSIQAIAESQAFPQAGVPRGGSRLQITLRSVVQVLPSTVLKSRAARAESLGGKVWKPGRVRKTPNIKLYLEAS